MWELTVTEIWTDSERSPAEHPLLISLPAVVVEPRRPPQVLEPVTPVITVPSPPTLEPGGEPASPPHPVECLEQYGLRCWSHESLL